MRINENLAISESGFLFNPSTGESFTVNPIGAEILEMMRDGRSADEIVEAICLTYGVDALVIQKDLHDFSETLKHHQLIDQHEETGL